MLAAADLSSNDVWVLSGPFAATPVCLMERGVRALRFGYTLLYVDDVEATLAFYESALGLSKKFLNKEGDLAYGELETGATTLGFVSHPLARSNPFGSA